MVLIGKIQINGVDQPSDQLELGVFCGDECRGASVAHLFTYVTPNYYMVDPMVYGDAGNMFTFKLYDHNLGRELDLTPPKSLAFNENGEGNPFEPYILNFTSLPLETKVFTNAAGDNMWTTADNWEPYGVPDATAGNPDWDVVLLADAVIAANGDIPTVAYANSIAFEGTPVPTLTVKDGCQLVTNSAVTAKVEKDIEGYGTGNEQNRSRYYLVASPLANPLQPAAAGMTANHYDLYSWDYSNDALEWQNYKDQSFSTLSNGKGYLYANSEDVTLAFTGTVKANDAAESMNPTYTVDGTADFNGWNLLGNPFACAAYITEVDGNGSETEMGFYRMNASGNGFQAVSGAAIAPMEGIFVKATATNQTFKFARTVPTSKSGTLDISLSSRSMEEDNAIVRFGRGSMLEKFSFRANSSKIYIPVDGKTYSIANAGSEVGEIPLSFEAKENGTYTLCFSNKEVSFAYLHLIDNKTGKETDLLTTPAYSFEALTTDYESRFKIVFATGSSTSSDTFVIYSNGNWVINNEGRATLQVIDVNGRLLKSENIDGCANVSYNVASGVYMLRLINGDSVMVQKVVVR
jgi:hypothetical protein